MVELKGTAFSLDPVADPFTQELYLFRWLEANLPKNNKKMVAVLNRIRPLCPEYMRNNFFRSALVRHSNDPMHYVKESIKYSYEFPRVMKELMDNGNHGMIFHGDEVHGVKLKTLEKWLKPQDSKWTVEQEEEIAHELMREWLVRHRLKAWVGRIVLFANFGFSGLTLETEWLIPDDDWAKLQIIWKKEDAAKDIAEMKKLLAAV